MTGKKKAPEGAAVRRKRNRPLFWGLVLCALAFTAIDAAWLESEAGIFTRGLNPRPWLDVPLFLVFSLLLDASVLLPLGWFLYMAIGRLRRPRRLNGAQRIFLTLVLAASPLVLADYVKFKIASTLGGTVNIFWIGKTAGADPPTILAAGGSYLFDIGVVMLVVFAVAAAILWLLGRIRPGWLADEASPRRPSARVTRWGRIQLARLAEEAVGIPRFFRSLGLTGVLALASVAMLIGTAESRLRLADALNSKVSGGQLSNLADRLTDFDLDGYGLVQRPVDFAPFNRHRHPYAVNVPGSGIDANGLGVILTSRRDFSAEDFGPVTFASRPDFLLIVLETYRYDNVGAKLGDKPVTPVLNRLIAEGAAFGKGYSPNCETIGGLNYLFRGGMTLASQTSIIDDFRANGYFTACVTAEDDSFGDIETTTGMKRADFFRDPRTSDARRTEVYRSIPWTAEVENVREFLKDERIARKPLFLYVNIQDCHHPYNHYAMEPLLDNEPIARSQISPENKAWLTRTYRNAAANADKALGQILDAVEKSRGKKPAFVILGDHGESLFDPDVLGHGNEMLQAQHTIPVVVRGFSADCVFPIGTDEIRGLIRSGLSRFGVVPASRVDPAKTVFLRIGELEFPLAIGAGGQSGILSYNFRRHAWHTIDNPPAGVTVRDVVELWEQIVYHRVEVSRSATKPPRDKGE